MGITFRILGAAGRDNALLVQVDSGQAVERLLFDCGDGCLSELSFAIDGATHSMDELREGLIVETPGDSIAYLTDFLLDELSMERLADALRGCRAVICEGQYRHADVELAMKNFHMTTVLSVTLAHRAHVEELVLFHLSDRYERADWVEMLREARQVFPKAHYPPQWNLEVGAEPLVCSQ